MRFYIHILALLFVASSAMGQSIRINPATGEQTYPADKDVLGKYPVFIFTPESFKGYCDFELKGSANNFAGDQMDYYYHSPGSLPYEVGDPPLVYFTSPFVTEDGHDSRAWVRKNSGASIYSHLDGHPGVGGIMVIITDPSVIAAARNNPNWVWSLLYFDPSGPEKSFSQTVIWRLVMPTYWTNVLPSF